MKLLWNEHVFGWRMTGLLGTGGLWFFGFSRAPSLKNGESVSIRAEWRGPVEGL